MKYLALILAALTTAEVQAYELAPRLVVSITIDQLRSDYLEAFNNIYSTNGFKKILEGGLVYEGANYPFAPIDRSSATASLSTGTTPFFNGIIGGNWLDRKTLRPTGSVDDETYLSSPAKLRTSTVGDELKVSSQGKALVYSFAPTKESAILSAGHDADGAFWLDNGGQWTGSVYYNKALPDWVRTYNSEYGHVFKKRKDYQTNDNVVDMALTALRSTELGNDAVSDLLSITLTAEMPKGKVTGDWQKDMASVYQKLDFSLGRIITAVENRISLNEVLFVVTSTGYTEEKPEDLTHYRIPTGTFYINRTASLLNMYLGAIYGQGRYVEECYENELYLNHRLIEQKRLSMAEILTRSQEFLLQNAGVADVYTSSRLLAGNNDILKIRGGYNPVLSGDIIINIAPGWRLLNETTQQTFTSRASVVPFPIIFFGGGIKHERVLSPVTVDRIAPTIAKTIRIRAPNACTAQPLF